MRLLTQTILCAVTVVGIIGLGCGARTQLGEPTQTRDQVTDPVQVERDCRATYAGPSARSGTLGAVPYPSMLEGIGDFSLGWDGTLWFSAVLPNAEHSVGHLSTIGKAEVFPLPLGTTPAFLDIGSDHAFWLVDNLSPHIVRIDLAGQVSEFELPHPVPTTGHLTLGNDGRLWYGSLNTSAVGSVSARGAISEYGVPNGFFPGPLPSPDGLLIVSNPPCEGCPFILDRLSNDGVFHSYSPLPEIRCVSLSRNGDLWLSSSSTLMRIGAAGSSATYPLPAKWRNACPDELTEGAGGDVWFRWRDVDDKIGRFSAGTLTDYSLEPESRPRNLVYGPDANLWFIETGRNQIARLSKSGAFSEFSPSKPDSQLSSLTLGSDCNLWIEQTAKRVEFIRP